MTHENWHVRRYSPERERVKVLSSIFYYSVNTVIWCSKQENSSDCLSYEMDIWQSMCVTPAIYGIRETVITLIFQTIKTGSRKSTIWFEKQLEYGHMKAHQNQLHGTMKTLPLNVWSFRVLSGRAAGLSIIPWLQYFYSCLVRLHFLTCFVKSQGIRCSRNRQFIV